MTVRELKEFLEECDQDIQVTAIIPDDMGFNVVYGIKSIEQVKPYSCHDESEYPNVVEIEIDK